MKKAPDAFRTISEVAEILDTPAHVLRFWESKFYQIRPVKRAGGRRYYRPDDVSLISGIKALLQDQGMTIRGVQRVLQEQGVRHVASLAGPLPALEVGRIVELPEEIEDPVALAGSMRPVADATEQLPEDAAEPVEDTVIPFEASGASDPTIEPDESIAAAPDTEAGSAPDVDAEEAPEDEALPLDVLFAGQDDLPRDVPADGGMPGKDQAAAVLGDPEAPPAGTSVADDEDTTEQLDTAPATTPDITPDHVVGAEEHVLAELSADAPELLEASDRAMLARRLRGLPRNALGPRRDRADLLAKRIDSLLERMSEASGAGRW